MKKMILLLLLTFILCGCGRADMQQGEESVNGSGHTGETESGQEAEAEKDAEAKGGQEAEAGQAEGTESGQETVAGNGPDGITVGEKASGCIILEDGQSVYLCSPYMLTKVDKGTGEAAVLWESDKMRVRAAEYVYSAGRGVLVGDIIYFIEEWMDESDENYGYTKKALNMIRTDGTGYRRLEEKNITDIYVQEGKLYLHISESEVYLLSYPLAEDGSLITEAATTDTRESRGIPGGYTSVNYFGAYGRKTLLPKESLEEFGYYLMRNEDYKLVRIFPETGEEELLPEGLSEGYLQAFNKEYLLMSLSEETHWDYYLVNRQSMEKKLLTDVQWNDELIAMDEEFVYLRRGKETAGKITEYPYEKVNLETGEVTQLFSQKPFIGLKTDPSNFMADTVLLNGYIYYVDMKDYKLYMMRRSIEEPAEAEILGEAFYDSGISEVGTVDFEYIEFYGDGTGAEESAEEPCAVVDLEWLVVDERYPGADRINSYMKETMDADISYERQVYGEVVSLREEYDVDFPAYSLSSDIYEIAYVDDRYVSFCQAYYEYTGGAHGMPYRIGYTFNLQTGELLTLTDVIGNTEEELKEIVGRYFEELINQNPEDYWDGSADSIREWTSFDSSFYLTEEGIRFYEGPYSISSYAAGFQEVTIPYSEFVMKIPVGENLKWDSVMVSEAELSAFAVQMTVEERSVFEAYYPVLKEGNEFVLCDGWDDEEEAALEATAVIDLDADGVQEVILRFAPFGDYLILHKEGEDFYGLMLVYRGFLMPKQDGTYISSGGAAYNLYEKVYFEGNKFHQEVLAEQADYESFYIGGESVSRQEFDDFIAGLDMDGKEDIVFYERKA